MFNYFGCEKNYSSFSIFSIYLRIYHKMKKITLSLTMLLFVAISTMAQVAINKDGNSADASAMLDIQANDAGFLPPRLKTTERNAIAAPAEGLVIYNVTTECLEFYRSGTWIQICGNSGTPENGAEYSIGSGGSCQNTVVSGTYQEGSMLDNSNTVTIDVLVTVVGNGTLSTDTVNGYSFTGSGSFGSTGVHQVTLTASGIPVAGQTDLFTVVANHGGGSCQFSVVVDPIPTAYNPTTGKTWMDRNLGASQVATSSTDALAYGDYYQWGRLADGHEDSGSGTTTTLSSTDDPGHSDFIIAPTNPYNWRNPENVNLWQSDGGINDPCPVGFRIPTASEWENERLSWATNDPAGAFGSPLKLTIGGQRSNQDAVMNDEGIRGYYWSRTVKSGTEYTHYLSIQSSSADVFWTDRADGMSIRCIKD